MLPRAVSDPYLALVGEGGPDTGSGDDRIGHRCRPMCEPDHTVGGSEPLVFSPSGPPAGRRGHAASRLGRRGGKGIMGRQTLFRQEVVEFRARRHKWGETAAIEPPSARPLFVAILATVAAAVAFLSCTQYARKEDRKSVGE